MIELLLTSLKGLNMTCSSRGRKGGGSGGKEWNPAWERESGISSPSVLFFFFFSTAQISNRILF